MLRVILRAAEALTLRWIHKSGKYDQAFFLDLAAKGKNDWNAWRRNPANKDVYVTFAGTDFSEVPKDKIDFTGFEFGDCADFSLCKWRGVDLFRAGTTDIFKPGRACFPGASFGGRAKFEGATFNDFASFTGASFGDRVTFTGTAFGQYASFTGGVVFGAQASFEICGFRRRGAIRRCRLRRRGELSGCHLR
jgi:hypothetical protein